jgi:hypothetical protein
MVESILNTIKQMLGISTTDTAFDTDIIVNINSAFMTLQQLGIGDPDVVFSIEDNTATWLDFLTTDSVFYPAVKTYIYLKVKLAFDPAGTSFVINSMTDQIRELEWRLTVQVPIPPDPILVPEE